MAPTCSSEINTITAQHQAIQPTPPAPSDWRGNARPGTRLKLSRLGSPVAIV